MLISVKKERPINWELLVNRQMKAIVPLLKQYHILIWKLGVTLIE